MLHDRLLRTGESLSLCQGLPDGERAPWPGEREPRKCTRSQFIFLFFREDGELSSQGNVLISKPIPLFFSFPKTKGEKE